MRHRDISRAEFIRDDIKRLPNWLDSGTLSLRVERGRPVYPDADLRTVQRGADSLPSPPFVTPFVTPFVKIEQIRSTITMTVPKMRYQSMAYGLLIESEFPLLSSSQKLSALEVFSPDIKVRSGTIADLEELEENGFSHIWASIPECGQFFFRDGCEMVVCPDPDIPLESLRAVILGSGISILLQQRNLLVLHASSVAINGQAIAFLGNSGWGKSTLVSTLHGKGYTFITDDVLPIYLDTTPPRVTPSYPEVKLLPETLAALGNTFELEDTEFASHWKAEKKITTRIANHSLPLLSLFILRVGDRHSIEPIPIQQAFLELSHHSRAIRMIDELDVPALRAAHFQQCTQLIQQIPCFYLQRRPALEELPQMVELIESQAQALMSTFS